MSRHSQSRALSPRVVQSDVSGSVVLLACTLIALAWANSPRVLRDCDPTETSVGILVVSLASGVFGYVLLHRSLPAPEGENSE